MHNFGILLRRCTRKHMNISVYICLSYSENTFLLGHGVQRNCSENWRHEVQRSGRRGRRNEFWFRFATVLTDSEYALTAF